MNATSALALVLILSFAADRLSRAGLVLLDQVPGWRGFAPLPETAADPEARVAAERRREAARLALAAGLALAALALLPQARLLQLLAGPGAGGLVDLVVSTVVIAGGADVVGRVVGVSGLGAAPGGAGGETPVKIEGRLELIPPAAAGGGAQAPQDPVQPPRTEA